MNKYLLDFGYAFQKVEARYFEFYGLNEIGEYLQRLENNFSSEIIRHMRNLMDKRRNAEYYQELICDFDIRKQAHDMQPDIVLHAANNNRNRQEIYAEVKTSLTVELEADLRKLVIAVTELEFKFGVLIAVNKPLDIVKAEIHEYMIGEACRYIEAAKLLDKLYLFHAVKNGDNTITHTIANFRTLFNF